MRFVVHNNFDRLDGITEAIFLGEGIFDASFCVSADSADYAC